MQLGGNATELLTGETSVIAASASYTAGQVIGVLILVLIVSLAIRDQVRKRRH